MQSPRHSALDNTPTVRERVPLDGHLHLVARDTIRQETCNLGNSPQYQALYQTFQT
jgi:hypothetical protein